MIPPLDSEWLETDGLGGFASGTVGGERTRRYHALLLCARESGQRTALANGFDAWVDTPAGEYPLSTQRYAPGVVHPEGHVRLADFEWEPWPCWKFRIEDDLQIMQEVFISQRTGETVLRWRGSGRITSARLRVCLFLSGRDYHALHHENTVFDFQPTAARYAVGWCPYEDLPEIIAFTNGEYHHEPLWYRNFLYQEDRRRGLDSTEDLAAPGTFTWDLAEAEAVLTLRAGRSQGESLPQAKSPVAHVRALRKRERARRAKFPSPLHRAADAYVVTRGPRRTIIAGYPWFTDWGRDTFLALRGLCLATGRLEDAHDILDTWAEWVSEGMLPNRFPEDGQAPEYNTVDAGLWYVVAVHSYLQAARQQPGDKAQAVSQRLRDAAEAIVHGCCAGTRYGIGMDADGLLAAGAPGVQLTWMDAKVGDWVVTPRIGKPVEVQALWLNALRIVGAWSPRWLDVHARAAASFQERFWLEDKGHLCDVVDVDHEPGKIDTSFRPNQILAVGGLPYPVLEGKRAARVVAEVESRLLTPLGLRSLAPGEPGYRPRYEGGVYDRDSAYHQGAVWPWLMGAFVEAWLRVRGDTPEAKQEAGRRFVPPLLDHLAVAGLGHVSEIADADPPHTPRGCPFQAWSLAELIRLMKLVDHAPPGPGMSKHLDF